VGIAGAAGVDIEGAAGVDIEGAAGVDIEGAAGMAGAAGAAGVWSAVGAEGVGGTAGAVLSVLLSQPINNRPAATATAKRECDMERYLSEKTIGTGIRFLLKPILDPCRRTPEPTGAQRDEEEHCSTASAVES
jgi:hypothetical protein